ncbi:hypothetical protein ABXN37_19360 [Piscinibacter sakaiensis]|uniref:Uncharacterized protein n=1 Tax=Piscinibacter sakaiensis TaxID=1547922 RepID=A0A0K8P3X9_PISS1|nr:hypothetical protein [Piscinibacter sakaiensis]GAP37286.1 hypothetical protein ISF6_3141 [Piscinibacter sakaiensis]
MKTTTVERAAWIALYGGMLTGSLGLFVRPQDGVLGWALLAVGVLGVAAGIALIVVRSRMSTKETR